MNFFKDFTLSKSLTNLFDDAMDIGADFLFGEKTMTSDMARLGQSPSRGGSGFLDTALTLGKKGFEAYQRMAREDGERPFTETEFEAPRIQRFAAQRTRVQAPSQSRWRPQNQMYRDALRRRMQNVNFERDLQRMTEATTVRPTSRRKAPEKVEPATIKRTMTAPRIK